MQDKRRRTARVLDEVIQLFGLQLAVVLAHFESVSATAVARTGAQPQRKECVAALRGGP